MLKPNTLEQKIIESVCTHYGISEDVLCAAGRAEDSRVTKAKRVTAYLLREETILSFQQISKRIGYKSKKSASTAYYEVQGTKDVYTQIAYDLNNIRQNYII